MICPVCTLREPHRPLVCDADRSRLAWWLREVVDLCAVLPAALEPGRGASERVGGSRSAPVPVNLSVVDLTLPSRLEPVHDPYGDQAGEIPVAARLDSWVEEWIEVRGMREHRPVPTVVTLAGWLGVRLEWACDQHDPDALAAWAAELGGLVRTLRGVLRLSRPRPELLDAPCPGCDLAPVLTRTVGDDWIECGHCGRLLSEDEYRSWVGLVAAQLPREDDAA